MQKSGAKTFRIQPDIDSSFEIISTYCAEDNLVTNDIKYEGGCYCGAVRYAIHGLPTWAGHCHCRSCQLALGGPFITWAKIAVDKFTLTNGHIKLCEKTSGIKRGFCGDCGTTLTYAAEEDVDGQNWRADAWFSATTLDDPSIIAPKAHVYVSHQQPWIKLADDLPSFLEF